MHYMSANAPVSFRFTPEVKTLLEKAAASDHRSQTNFMEILIRNYCASHGISSSPYANVAKKPIVKQTKPKN